MADIFISYSRKDTEHAQMLADRLRTSGASVWMDTAALAAAETWSAEIVHAIKECSTLVVLLSPDSVASHNVTKEVGLASEMLKQIVPIEIISCELSDALIYSLAGVHRISLFDEEALLRSFAKLGIGNPDISLTTSQTDKNVRPTDLLLRLAVLPFDDLSPAKDNEWFADGMMDELINTLGSLEKLHVNPRTDVIYYKGKKPKIDELAADLKCRYIIEGGVQKSGEKIRIRVSLSDAKEHKQIWSEKYDGTFDDIFDLQESVARKIAEALKIKLTPDDVEKIEKKLTDNPEAYELYLKGSEFLGLNGPNVYLFALQLFEEALKIDPNFAEAYLGKALACCNQYREASRNHSFIERAKEYVAAAEAIQGVTPRSVTILAQAAYMMGNPEEAIEAFNKAVALYPKNTLAYNSLSNLYFEAGRYAEAIEATERCIEINPSVWGNHVNQLFNVIELGDRERMRMVAMRALPVIETHIRKNPEDYDLRTGMVGILFCLERREEALHELNTLAANNLIGGVTTLNVAFFYQKLGYPKRSLEFSELSIVRGMRPLEEFSRIHYDAPEDQAAHEVLTKKLREIIAKENNG